MTVPLRLVCWRDENARKCRCLVNIRVYNCIGQCPATTNLLECIAHSLHVNLEMEMCSAVKTGTHLKERRGAIYANLVYRSFLYRRIKFDRSRNNKSEQLYRFWTKHFCTGIFVR